MTREITPSFEKQQIGKYNIEFILKYKQTLNVARWLAIIFRVERPSPCNQINVLFMKCICNM